MVPLLAAADEPTDQRVAGLLWGSVVGDALGGPVEFARPDAVTDVLPGFRSRPDKRLDAAGLRRLAVTLPLLPYGPFRPAAEPYGQWSPNAPAGTVTDDTRHKMVLIDALRRTGRLDRRSLAESYLRFEARPEVTTTPGWKALHERSFREFLLSARWEIGERDLGLALPPSRMWGGLGTCCGQMALPPLAALYPGRPEAAYLAAYGMAWFDNGEAKDLNAAFVAGLAFALERAKPQSDPASRHGAWRAMLDAMAETDPLRYGEIEYVERSLDATISRATAAARRANGSPAELYRLIEEGCPRVQAWEAKFLLFKAVALTEFCRGEPLAAMHLALDFGLDTDSAAQLMGAWFGALYGPELFPADWRQATGARLQADYNESLSDWVRVLAAARKRREPAAE